MLSTTLRQAIRPSAGARAPRLRAPRSRDHPRAQQAIRRRHVYDNFDLDIPRGKLVSIFGPNGCGKSTLINMIAGLIPRDAGEILFDGKPLSEINSATCSRTTARRCFPGCARSTISNIRSS